MAQEHQEYIQSKVNPILENLVTQLLLERPEHLAPFMIKWLSEHAKTPVAAALTEGVNELSELKAELEKLQEEVKQLEQEVGEKGGGDEAAQPDEGDRDEDEEVEEEEEEEDDDEDDAAPPPVEYLKKVRASVSAEAYGEWNKKRADFSAPVYAKSEEQKARIQSVLKQSFLFASLEPKDLAVVIDAMQEKIIEKDTRIINQGDDGDCLFVVEEGQMNCYRKAADGEDKLVKECQAGDAFGELALLYNCPRAASVVAHEKCVLWELDRETFGHIVSTSARERRKRYEDFLKNVPILSTVEAYERSSMCDALQIVRFSKGETIIKQGDSGDTFYILEEGECYAEKVYVEGTPPQEVYQYQSGGYFGELALLVNEARAASVIARTDVKLLTLQRRTFKDLLGPLEDILKRNATSNYR